MSGSSSAAPTPSRLRRLLDFLDQDPNNLSLMADAASAAVDEGDYAQVEALLDRYAGLSPLPPFLAGLNGLAAMEQRRFDDAAEIFAGLRADNPADPNLKFNLAWCEAARGRHEAALALLDDEGVMAVARAPALRINALHHLGRVEEALSEGEALSRRFPQDAALSGALAAVALDADQLSLAETYARRAGDQHEALAVLGALDLNRGQADQSLALFDRALAKAPQDSRALLGKGLALVSKGDPQAPAFLDRAAEGFGRHLGAWIAAGWAYFVAGDYKTSRARFERAEAIDDTFAETHGALAVLDVVEGRIDSAKRRTEVALRLDRNCFSAALAKSLIVAGQGDPKAAERIRAMALNAPIDASGRTLGQMMAAVGRIGPKR